MDDAHFTGFAAADIEVGDTHIFIRRGGTGPAVLLLHGFPQSHLMWRAVAPLLAASFTVICADLPGYGGSGIPGSRPDHAPYSKRAMARRFVRMMDMLGIGRFCVAGHDRGGRVAYRLALDHPDRVARLAVLDILPVAEAWHRADKRFALGYWPWSLLAQEEPLPEKLVSAAPEAVVDNALAGWGSRADVFGRDIRAAYTESLRDPARVHAICEEYRAAAGLDDAHDQEDRGAGRRIVSPTLVLWSRGGPLDTWYKDVGGPLVLWRSWAEQVQGEAVAGGHFFPEENPQVTADKLERFFKDAGTPDEAALNRSS
jgi:haloacetate dehalogenase